MNDIPERILNGNLNEGTMSAAFHQVEKERRARLEDWWKENVLKELLQEYLTTIGKQEGDFKWIFVTAVPEKPS